MCCVMSAWGVRVGWARSVWCAWCVFIVCAYVVYVALCRGICRLCGVVQRNFKFHFKSVHTKIYTYYSHIHLVPHYPQPHPQPHPYTFITHHYHTTTSKCMVSREFSMFLDRHRCSCNQIGDNFPAHPDRIFLKWSDITRSWGFSFPAAVR